MIADSCKASIRWALFSWNVALAKKHFPQNLCCVFGLRKKRGAILNQGVGLGSGSAARNTSSTSRTQSMNIGKFSCRRYCQPFIVAAGTCLDSFCSELVRKQTLSSGIFLAWQQYMIVTPVINGSSTFSLNHKPSTLTRKPKPKL